MARYRTTRGFTLIEILIVVVILGVLSAIIIPRFAEATDDAAANSARSTLRTVRTAIELYRFKESAEPTSFADLINSPSGNQYIHANPGPLEGYNFIWGGPPAAVTVNDPDGNPTGW